MRGGRLTQLVSPVTTTPFRAVAMALSLPRAIGKFALSIVRSRADQQKIASARGYDAQALREKRKICL